MADAWMPEEFYELARPMLPAEKEIGPHGGRPATSHHTVLKVIWFVLATGIRWKDVPQEMGCCGETARTRLQAWERAGIWDRLHQLLLTMLNREKQLHLETAIIDTTQVRAFGGGEETGPSPVDRRKAGTKYALLVDRDGVPLVLRAAPANRSDHSMILPTVKSFPNVGGKPGRPLTHPKDLYADAGFDSEATRSILRWLGIEPHIRRRGDEHGSHSVASVGSWSAASVGSKDCAVYASVTIAPPRRSTPGPASPPPSSACKSSPKPPRNKLVNSHFPFERFFGSFLVIYRPALKQTPE